MRRCFRSLLLTPFLVSSLYPQAAAPTAGSGEVAATFKAQVHAVLVDVVVMNGKNEPISGLHKDDFQISEDGQPQTISSFEEHLGAPPARTPMPPMPPHVYSNFPATKAADSVNVLLLDALNTPAQDQVFVHTQMLKYLKSIPPGTRLAVFTLASKLRMLQGFDDDSSTLLAALKGGKKEKANPKSSPLLSPKSETDVDQQFVDFLAANNSAQEVIDGMKQFQADNTAFQAELRIKLTLQSLQALARYLSTIPGRKNVIWFSGSFPINIFANTDAPDPLNASQRFQKDIEETATLLTADQVALYPVGAEGLSTTSLQADSEANTQRSARQVAQAQGQDLRGATINVTENHDAMEELAKDTGGQAFHDTNGLSDVLTRLSNSATRYYTLTYSPSNPKKDGTFRHIQVKVKENYRLSYRRGYYSEREAANANASAALPADTAQTQPEDPLLPLMSRGLPDFAQVLYKIRVLASNPQPPADAALLGGNNALKKPVTRYGVDFAVSVDDLKLDLAPDGTRQGKIEIMLVAYDSQGKPLNWVIRKPRLSLAPQVYASFQQVGLQIHQEIDVPRGDVYLRTGIYDAVSSKAGTLGVPLSLVNATPTR